VRRFGLAIRQSCSVFILGFASTSESLQMKLLLRMGCMEARQALEAGTCQEVTLAGSMQRARCASLLFWIVSFEMCFEASNGLLFPCVFCIAFLLCERAMTATNKACSAQASGATATPTGPAASYGMFAASFRAPVGLT
jgi:hypothetical protein